MTQILIVEDQALLRDSLEHIINEQSDMEVVGSTDDAAASLGLCRKLKPDLVLMDAVTKNNTSGITHTALIRKEFPGIKIVVITALPEITFAEEARKAGAHSFMDKSMGNEHLFHIIRSTMKGFSIYSSLSKRMPFTANFTDKEIALIRLVCQGMTRNEIAKKISLPETRIKQLITSILNKTGFDSISKFAIYALGEGLIAPAFPA